MNIRIQVCDSLICGCCSEWLSQIGLIKEKKIAKESKEKLYKILHIKCLRNCLFMYSWPYFSWINFWIYFLRDCQIVIIICVWLLFWNFFILSFLPFLHESNRWRNSTKLTLLWVFFKLFLAFYCLICHIKCSNILCIFCS